MLKNIYILWTLIFIFIAVCGYLLIVNDRFKDSLSEKLEIIQSQSDKINQYDSLSEEFGKVFNKINKVHRLNLSPDNLFDELDIVFNTKKELQESHELLNNIRKNYSDEISGLQSQILSDKIAMKKLMSEKDSLSNLFYKKSMQYDSLINQISNISIPEDEFNIDTLNLFTEKGVEIFYFGHLIDNKAEGFGVGFYKHLGYYIGNWSDNKRNGIGKHTYLNGDVYEGSFKYDLREGYGIYYYHTGDRFEGWWRKDLMHGEGKIIPKNGKEKSGTWSEGKLVK